MGSLELEYRIRARSRCRFCFRGRFRLSDALVHENSAGLEYNRDGDDVDPPAN